MTRDWNGPNTGIWLARGARGNNAVTTASKETANISTSSSSSAVRHGSVSYPNPNPNPKNKLNKEALGQQSSPSFANWFLREAWAQGDALMQKTEKGTGR